MTGYTQHVFQLVLARPMIGTTGDDPALVHLWWRAPQQGERLVQVYVDDELYDVTAHTQQRAMWLLLNRTQPHRIELLAVDPAAVSDVWQPQPTLLGQWSPPVRDVAAVSVLRDEALPVDAQLAIEVDGQAAANVPLWPGDEPRGGFGALFGQGGFGADAATGPGLGEGELGVGPLGADGTALHWRRPNLPDGERQLALNLLHRDGQPATDAPTHMQRTIERLPEPAAHVQLDPPATLRWQ